jgi:hypothetical protein
MSCEKKRYVRLNSFEALLTALQVADSRCTIAYGFYALMGGFVIDIDKLSEAGNPTFINGVKRLSLTPKGLLLLAKCGHLPEVTEEEILDKSKVDELGKLLACTHVTWMVIHVCTRLGMHLPVTTLEVTAVSHVMCALVLYALWWHKPRKVDEPTVTSGEWVGPLAGLMLMCSRESKGQMLPEYQLKGEHSEMAGLKVVTADGLVDGDPDLEGQFRFVRKSGNDSHQYHTHVESRWCKNTDGALAEMKRMALTQGVTAASFIFSKDLGHTLDSTTKARWDLAYIAIRRYDAVRQLRRSPPTEHNRYYEIALATYPEMPERCRLEPDVEEIDSPRCDWLECTTQHFVSTVASNWPHDGLLRTTSGLWIGTSLWIVSIAFSGVHIAAWRAPFPTEVEAWVWRCASIYVAFSGLLWAGIHVLASLSARTWWVWYDTMSGQAPKWLNVVLGIVCGICGVAYLFSRAYLIIESFISLRHLPVAAYVVPEWTLGVPHIA